MTTQNSDQAQPQSLEDRVYAQFDHLFPEDQPLPERAEESDEEEGEVEGDDNPPADDAAPEPKEGEETVEIEYDGQKVIVPKFLEPAILKNADYTQKTQELARQRELVEHQQKAFETSRIEQEFTQAVGPDFDRLRTLEQRTEQLEAIDPRTLPADEMMLHVYELNEARRQAESLKQQIASKRGEFLAKRNDKMSELRESAKTTLKKQVPSLTDESLKDAMTRAKDYGYTDADLEWIALDPRALALLYKATRFDQLQAKSAKAVESATPVVKAGPSNPMPPQVRDKLNYRKAMQKATTSTAKERLIAKRLEGLF